MKKKDFFEKIVKDKIDAVVLLAIVSLFACFCILFDVKEYGDSYQYLHQHPMREPVYSLLLQFLQFLKGDNYGVLLGTIQNILAVVCTYWTYKRITKIYGFGTLFRIGTVVVLLVPHIITPVLSKTHMILTNGVMTEGITVALYDVWFTMMLGILVGFYKDEEERKSVIVSLVLALLLSLTRGQMMLCIVIWLLVVIYRGVRSRKKTAIIIALLGCAIAVFSKGQLTKWYNLAEKGYYVETVSSKPMLMANIVYVCSEEDAKYIQDDGLRKAFLQIVRRAEADGKTVNYAEGNIIDKALYHEDCHDELNFDYIDPAVREVIYEKYAIDEEHFFELMIKEDELCGVMAIQLLPHIWPRFLQNYISIVGLGFVRSVATEKMHMTILAILIYILAIVLMISGFFKENKQGAYSMLLVLITVAGTVMGTALVIQCITRYMIYNFPFFYIAGMSMVRKHKA